MRTYDAFEFKEIIDCILSEKDDRLRLRLKRLSKSIENEIINDGLCPECGGEIDFYRDEYGEYIECPECGWKEE